MYACRIQYPFLVWITSILSDAHIRIWRPELVKEVTQFTMLDILLIFLAFFIIYMVSLHGKSTYFSGLCLVAAYVVFLLTAYYE